MLVVAGCSGVFAVSVSGEIACRPSPFRETFLPCGEERLVSRSAQRGGTAHKPAARSTGMAMRCRQDTPRTRLPLSRQHWLPALGPPTGRRPPNCLAAHALSPSKSARSIHAPVHLDVQTPAEIVCAEVSAKLIELTARSAAIGTRYPLFSAPLSGPQGTHTQSSQRSSPPWEPRPFW